MPRVYIPPQMQDLTEGQGTLDVPGDRVDALIDELDKRHPGLRARLCDGDALRSGIAVVIDTDVATLGLRARVKPESEVHFLPALSGG